MRIFRSPFPALLWTITVSILTLMPGKNLPKVNVVNFDKAAHLGVFGLLNLLWLLWLAADAQHADRTKKITLGCMVYGGSIELLQGAFTDRAADWIDFVFNVMGCLLVLPLFRFLQAKLN